MAWIAVDKSGCIYAYATKPVRHETQFEGADVLCLVDCDIAHHLLGRRLTWDDEPIEIGEIKPQPNPIGYSDELKRVYKEGFKAAADVLSTAYESIKQH